MDCRFFLTLQALRRQLAAMPCDFYLIRLIHRHTRKALPGDRVWTAPQVLYDRTVSFLRARNREGYDVYFQPYAFQRNAGYILVDLDRADPAVLDTMQANGHQPCVVIETSPGHLQAWIQVSAQPLEPAVATAIGRQLARLYQGDRASADWRHLGRLAGFTNQKPQRILPVGWPPWVKVRRATVGLAADGNSLIETALRQVALATAASPSSPLPATRSGSQPAFSSNDTVGKATLTAEVAAAVYQTCLQRLRIPQRFPRPDWSIADLWIATELLLRGTPATDAKTILRLGSPQFPRRHAAPEDYLRRTLAQAVQRATFPARHVASTFADPSSPL
jgi:hypothetical protein